jgi:MFS family permease
LSASGRGTSEPSAHGGFVFRALRHRNFRLFFAGQLISLIGTWMQSVAQSWLAYRLTGSAAMLGLVGFASQIPAFLLAPAGGVVADRFDKRRLLVATQSASMVLALALAGLTLSGRVTVHQILLLASMLGLVNAFDVPVRQAFVVEMVGREDLLNAIALNSSVFNGARIVGPAIAGLLVARVGEGWCFLVNGASYLAVIAGLGAMRLAPAALDRQHAPPLESLREGLRHVWGNRPVRALLALLGVVSLTGMPYAVLMPIFADRILHGGARGLGLLMGATGVGALVGALTLAGRRGGIRGLGGWVAGSAAGLGVFLVAFSQSTRFWLSAALLVPVGLCMMVEMAASNTVIQSLVPDALRGRVMAAYAMMFLGMAPFGALFAGAIAARIGAPPTVAIGGAACALAALVFWRRLDALREEARQIVVALQAAGGEPAEQVSGAASSLAPRS